MLKEKDFKVIPSWLQTPSKTIFAPPVDTKIQELPFGELAWEDFERLCLRLVKMNSEIEYCQLYGTRGQDQEGIDLFARRTNEKYFVYQCKRVINLGPSSIKSAIEKFLEGEWVNKTDTFVLCTSESMIPTERANEIEAQREILKKEGIKLITWDKETLSTLLKGYPEIVDDFFGRAWVEKFCGNDKAMNLGARLDNNQVQEFRNHMKLFYQRVFQIHDPGLPTATNMNMSSITLDKRFVLPDITDKQTFEIANNSPNIEQKYNEEYLNTDSKSKEKRENKTTLNTTYRRKDFESWLTNSKGRNIILGGPGSGKSTLLRYIAIDLLSDAPRLNHLTKKWGSYLPIWIPFALWTKYISESKTGVCSLKEVLMGWLKSWDEERLWPLVEQALDDRRLLLLVDGLDEGTTEHASRIALSRLTVFVQQRNIQVILTSRPHGFERIGLGAGGWEIGELSDFSIPQQKSLLKIWFNLWHQSTIDKQQLSREEIKRRTSHAVEDFMNQLQKSTDLRDLAKVPLLLSLLILLKINDSRLPQNRFKAYEKLIELLISTHPQKRIAAAGVEVNGLELNDDEVKIALSFLAFTIHEKHNEGIIHGDEAISQLERFLKDEEIGLGLPKRDASRISKLIINLGEGNLGLLVSKSPTEIGFFHRAFQEFLASYFLYISNREKILQVIEKHFTNSQWHEVILGLFFISNRSEDIKDYTELIDSTEVSNIDSFNKNVLLYEAAFGPYNMPVLIAKKYCRRAFDEIETGHWMPYRERILKIVIDGLKSSRLKELIKVKIREWFPNRSIWRESLIESMSDWEDKDDRLVSYFFRGLFDESYSNKKASINALVKRYSGHEKVGNFLVDIVKGPRDSITKALITEGLMTGWPKHQELDLILEEFRNSISPELILVSMKAKVTKNSYSNEDLDILLSLGSNNSNLNYNFQDDIVDLVLKGWPNSSKVKSICLHSLKSDYNQENLDSDISLQILFNGYSKEDEFFNYCLEEIREQKYPFLGLASTDYWKLVKEKYHGNTLISEAMDDWLQKNQDSDEVTLANASLVTRSSIAREILLRKVKESNFPQYVAWALYEGWGLQDKEVAKALDTLVNGLDSVASSIGHLIPKLIKDKKNARNKIMQLIMSESYSHLNLLLMGLEDVWEGSIENEVKEYLLEIVKNTDYDSSAIFSNRTVAISFLIQNFSEDHTIKELAMQELTKRNAPYDLISRYYDKETLVQNFLLEIAFPLPVQLRQVIANYLGEDLEQEKFNISLLQLYDYEVDPIVKTQSSISFYKYMKSNEEANTKLIENLSQSIVCYGLGYEERRQAAFCGLTTLKKLEVFFNAKDKRRKDEINKVPLKTHYDNTNIPFLKNLLENWSYIKSYTGEDISKRFDTHTEDPLYFWEEISLVISDDHNEIRQDVIKFLETRDDRTIRPKLLKLLSKESPNSPLLLEYVLESLKNQPNLSVVESDELRYIASEILSEHFQNDVSVLKTIKEFLGNPDLFENAIIAICIVGTDEKTITEILHTVREKKMSLSLMAYFELISRALTTEEIYEKIIEHLYEDKNLFVWNKESMHRPIIRRIREDDELYEKLLNKLSNQATPIETTNILKLIAASRGVTPELREIINNQLDYEWNNVFFQDVEDLISGKIRPIIHVLLEI